MTSPPLQWDPAQYLQFVNERTRPCRDLVAALDWLAPRRIVDLGCGPGNSTRVLAERWPAAQVQGVDQSAEMLASARHDLPGCDWQQADLGDWIPSPASFDLIFSNAAVQWVPHHDRLMPRLWRGEAKGGALAIQLPCNPHTPAHTLPAELAAEPAWRSWFPHGLPPTWSALSPAAYYDLLAPLVPRLDVWVVVYQHVLPSVQAIVEWYRGTGLRPWLQSLPTDSDRHRFCTAYADRLAPHYPPRTDGRVILPFERLFLVARH